MSSCAIFLDLAKAFDTVSHDILLQKLEAYGIRGNSLKLFESYLKDRYQFVKLNNEKSEVSLIEFGVPQGSILGPLLFLFSILITLLLCLSVRYRIAHRWSYRKTKYTVTLRIFRVRFLRKYFFDIVTS